MWNYTQEPIENILKPISEIRQRFQDLIDEYDVRDIIEETRNKIISAYPNLEFRENTHQYFYNNKELIPVSHVVEMFVPYTDFDKVAENFAKKRGYGNKEIWRRRWGYKALVSTTSGSLTHLFGETLVRLIWNEQDKLDKNFLSQFLISYKNKDQYIKRDNYLLPLYAKQIAVYKFFEDLYDNQEIPVSVECKLIWDDISGTFDLLTYSLKDKTFKIRDYKTNITLTQSFKKSMLKPYEGYNVEALSEYTIQQNIYYIMLKNIDIDVKEISLIWLQDNEKYNKINIPIIEDKVKYSIELLKNN